MVWKERLKLQKVEEAGQRAGGRRQGDSCMSGGTILRQEEEGTPLSFVRESGQGGHGSRGVYRFEIHI